MYILLNQQEMAMDNKDYLKWCHIILLHIFYYIFKKQQRVTFRREDTYAEMEFKTHF